MLPCYHCITSSSSLSLYCEAKPRAKAQGHGQKRRPRGWAERAGCHVVEIKYPPLLPCYYPVLIPWLQTHSWNTPVLEHVHKCPLGLVKKYHVINTIARSAPAAHTQIHRSACSVLYLRVYFQSHGPNYTQSQRHNTTQEPPT
eukprot:scaffold110519_cov48-Phaeocystis_antarctica.AAC.2